MQKPFKDILYLNMHRISDMMDSQRKFHGEQKLLTWHINSIYIN